MMFIQIFYDMESAAVDIKVNISCFKIRCDCLPHSNFRMQFLYRTPCGIAYGMRYTLVRDLSQVRKWVRLKFAAMNIKKFALHVA